MIGLLEALGTQSIRTTELKPLIGLFPLCFMAYDWSVGGTRHPINTSHRTEAAYWFFPLCFRSYDWSVGGTGYPINTSHRTKAADWFVSIVFQGI